MLFISSQNLRKKKRQKKKKHVQPSLLSDLPPWVGSKVDWPWHEGQFRPLEVDLYSFHPLCGENIEQK